MKISSSIKQWLMPTLGCVVLAMTSQSRAAVTATFEQLGADVIASWSGSIDFGTSWSHDETIYAPTSGYIDVGGSTIYGTHHGVEVDSYSGVAEAINFTYTIPPLYTGGPGDAGYGIKDGNFIIRGSDNDTAPISSIFTFPAGTHLIIRNTTLAALGADSFDNTLAWTSTTGDTVSYTTIVPEPSSTALLGMGCLALSIRRKR